MLIISAARCIANLSGKRVQNEIVRNFSLLTIHNNNALLPARTIISIPSTMPSALKHPDFLKIAINNQQQVRTVTKFSLKKGKRKSVRAVLKRFYRLDWGMWIRTRSGRHKKIWKKTHKLRRKLRQHVFTNSTQSWLLDKMVTKFWRRPKYYVDDPYAPYHRREEFWATRKKPISYE